MNWPTDDKRRRRLVLAGLLTLTCVLGLRGIGDESSVMLGGDMARYVMNGVFVHDLVADGGVRSYDELTQYAERYYAKYPALSLGHHPPLPYLSLVPFFWAFGVSLFAVRLAALCWFVLGAWGLYAVAARLFTWQVAAWAWALFVTNLLALRSGQYLLSEMPMATLAIWSVHALLRFCEKPSPVKAATFGALVIGSLYAKQLAILMFPVYGVIVVTHFGWRIPLRSRVMVGAGLAFVLSVPLVLMTIGLAPENFEFALRNMTSLFEGNRRTSTVQIVETIIWAHLSIPALIMTAASVAVLIARRRRAVLFGLVWIICMVGGSVLFGGATESARYAFGAVPAYFTLTGGLAAEARTRISKAVVAVLLTATFWWQLWIVRDVHPSGAGGYEAAAEYAIAQAQEPAILYDSSVDTGYFVFFMRKHDPQGRHVIVRADKLLPPRDDDTKFEEVDFRHELQRLGIRWIVVEERQTGNRLLRAFHDDLKSAAFAERLRIPVVSTAAPGHSLRVYEYLDAQPVNLDAELRIGVPLARRNFSLRLRDLLEGR